MFFRALFFVTTLTLAFSNSAFADRECFCKAIDPGGNVLKDYGQIHEYGFFELGVDNKCRFSCVTKIQAEIVYVPSWNGTWNNAANVCAWTNNEVVAIRSKSKVGADGFTIADAITWAYSCSGEPCPSGASFAAQTKYGPFNVAGQPSISTYNEYAVLTKDGTAPTAGLEVQAGQTAPTCPAAMKAGNKCVYYRAQEGEDECLAMNPPPYTVGAVPVATSTANSVCPPAKKPTYSYKVLDDVINYFGVNATSSLDNCEIP